MNHPFEENEKKDAESRMASDWQRNFRVNPKRPIIGGIIIILAGIALLVKRIPGIGETIPDWLFTWPMILILIGISIGIKHRNLFKGFFFILIGLFFLLDDENLINTSFRPFFLPVLIIIFGLFLILHRHNKNRYMGCRRGWRGNFYPHRRNFVGSMLNDSGEQDTFDSSQAESKQEGGGSYNPKEDYLDVTAIFGGIKKNYYSKNFKGGEIVCVFGGGKIDFINADIQGTAVLNISAFCGGVEIIVPSNWRVQNDLNAILGGVEDKRSICRSDEVNPKTLILRGNVFCGGVELRT